MTACPSGIYCIRNTVSGRVYVGSAMNFKKRFREHLWALEAGRHYARVMQRSWNRHDPDAFVFEVLERVPEPTKAALLAREQHYIDTLQAFHPKLGFNTCPTAGSSLGRLCLPATRAKIGAANTGRKRTAEHKAKISQATKGRPKSDETRGRMQAFAATREGVPRPPEVKANMLAAAERRVGSKHKEESRAKTSESMKRRWKVYRADPERLAARVAKMQRGVPHSDETKAKISEGNKGKTLSPEHRAKLSNKVVSDETRALMSEAQKRRIIPPEVRAKQAESMRGKTHSPETKAKMSASAKGKIASEEARANMAAGQKRRQAVKRRDPDQFDLL